MFKTYAQPNHPLSGKPPHLSSEEYKRGMQKWIKVSHDVVIVGPDGKFYLAMRRMDKNLPGPWFIGGQMSPFADISASLREVFKRETGVDIIDTKRFEFICENRYFFNAEDEDPIPHDTLCKVFLIHLSREEIESISLDSEEYENTTLQLFRREDFKTLDTFKQSIFIDLWDKIHT